MERLRRIASRAVGIFGSYGLACVILLLLMVLTFLGTLEQADHSLHSVRTKYFDSLFFFPDLLPVPLPGAYLLLGVLFVNLVVGGLVRMRRTRSRIGVFVIHIGIAVLLLSGLLEYHASNKGYVTLFEGDSAAHFQSHYEWEVTVAERLPDGRERAYVIPHEQFAARGRIARFRAAGLPFDVELRGFLPNCRPRRVSAGGDGAGIDGFALAPLERELEAERDIAGVTASLVEPDGTRHDALLWGLEQAPFRVVVAGRPFSVGLHKRRWDLPFAVTLRRFTRELHPRTGIPASFASDVTRIEDNVAQDVHISMNEPMRHGGYTFYQSGWGPQNAGANARLFSTFSVVENPADQGPLVACVVIALGLLWQFTRKLVLHVRAEARRRE